MSPSDELQDEGEGEEVEEVKSAEEDGEKRKRRRRKEEEEEEEEEEGGRISSKGRRNKKGTNPQPFPSPLNLLHISAAKKKEQEEIQKIFRHVAKLSSHLVRIHCTRVFFKKTLSF